jgi:hypothetical protein
MSETKHTSAADFPYDPTADARYLDGLNKLRAIEDRKIAQAAYDLYMIGLSRGASLPPVTRAAAKQGEVDIKTRRAGGE